MTRALRVRCSRCLAAPGIPCRSISRAPHVVRVLDGKRWASPRKWSVSVSAAGYAAIKAEATARGVSMRRIAEERIAVVTGGIDALILRHVAVAPEWSARWEIAPPQLTPERVDAALARLVSKGRLVAGENATCWQQPHSKETP